LHVSQADLALEQAVEQAIVLTLPGGPGQRNRKLFDLARRLKSIEGLDTSPRNLRRIVVRWHRRALPFIRTKDFGESMTDFAVAWQRVLTPAGVSMRSVIEEARGMPLPAAAANYDDEAIRLLVAVCSRLQQRWGKKPFFLSVRQAAELLGTSRMGAWRTMQLLQFDGVITRVSKGTLEDKNASEWRYTA
jgi:hypothetical protein